MFQNPGLDDLKPKLRIEDYQSGSGWTLALTRGKEVSTVRLATTTNCVILLAYRSKQRMSIIGTKEVQETIPTCS